jgi:2-phosphosulfolactate phosphatase
VIPAGEMWEDGTLRPSVEDWIGAGAVISSLSGTYSPEARLAATAFDHVRDYLTDYLRACSSGKELIERGFGEDVDLAAEYNVSHTVPRLVDRAFVSVHQSG